MSQLPSASLIKKSWLQLSGYVLRSFLKYGTNSVKVYNFDILKRLIEDRGDLGFISVANHTSTMDDPFIWGILPHSHFSKPTTHFRWALGAEDILFTNRVISALSRSGQALPITRGGGISQEHLSSAIEYLNKGAWIHIYSEGRVNPEPPKLLRLKWGISRLVMEAKTPPLILPVFHIGMEKIKPLHQTIPHPHLFQNLVIGFGEPIDAQILLLETNHLEATERRIQITSKIQNRLQSLGNHLANLIDIEENGQGKVNDRKLIKWF